MMFAGMRAVHEDRGVRSKGWTLVATTGRGSSRGSAAVGARTDNAVAGLVVAKHLGKEHEADVPAAMADVRALASPGEGVVPGRSSADPESVGPGVSMVLEVATTRSRSTAVSAGVNVRIQACMPSPSCSRAMRAGRRTGVM